MGRRLVVFLLVLVAALPATAAAAPTVREYDLGRLDLAQDNPVFPTVPIELQGVIGVPEGSHAAPVDRGAARPPLDLRGRRRGRAVALPAPAPSGATTSASATSWSRSPARGYLALAVNLNAAYTLGAGETPDEGRGRTDAIVAAQLAAPGRRRARRRQRRSARR